MRVFTKEEYELAALAAGLTHLGWKSGRLVYLVNNQFVFWNPPEDDGDALRLANRLRICVEFGYCEDDAPVIWVGLIEDRHNWPRYAHFPDPNAATRRAIFRAAIEIGRKLRAQNPQPSV